MINKPAKTVSEINGYSRNRWSPRAFDVNKQVSKEQIVALCEAAQWSPSSYNDQPWRFIVCDRFSDENSYIKLLSCLGEWNQNWAKTAPILIAVVASNTFSKTGKENRWGQYDSGAAAMSLCLEANHQGLSAHQMGGFDANLLAEKFEIPANHTPMAVIAVGYQAVIDVIDESFHEAEKAERKRNPLGDMFFLSKWGNGII